MTKIHTIIRNISISSLLTLAFLSFNSAAAEDNILICSNCSAAQMSAMAQLVTPTPETIKTHVVDPYSGMVKAFNISQLIRDPSTARVIPTNPSPEITQAALEAKIYLEDITISAQTTHKNIIDDVRAAYPKGLPNHITVKTIPASIAPSGLDISIGNEYHIAVSQYLSDNINFSLVHSIVGQLISSLGHVVITVFEGDGSLMVFVPKLSTIKFEPLSLLVLSEDGTILRAANASSIYGGSGGDTFSGNYIEQGGNFYVMTCSSWVTVGNTTADGTYCSSYTLIRVHATRT